MILLYGLLFLLVLYRIKFVTNNTEYLSFDNTNAIKGIFILLVFIAHGNGYFYTTNYAYDGWGDAPFLTVQKLVGQWIVALFLFYSGYGVMESIRKKGVDYVNRLPKHRILTVLLNFDVAVLFFLVLNLIFGFDFTWQRCLLSLICWEDLGNSNWYIFTIIICYFLIYLAFKWSHYQENLGILLCCVLTLVAMGALIMVKGDVWYNTICCFPMGVLFSKYRGAWELWLRKWFYLVLPLSVVVYVIGLKANDLHPALYNISAMAVVTFVVVLTMKVKIGNAYLIWLGKNLFPLYIYQRIPMIIFSETGLMTASPMGFWAACFAVTMLFGMLYPYWQIKLK